MFEDYPEHEEIMRHAPTDWGMSEHSARRLIMEIFGAERLPALGRLIAALEAAPAELSRAGRHHLLHYAVMSTIHRDPMAQRYTAHQWRLRFETPPEIHNSPAVANAHIVMAMTPAHISECLRASFHVKCCTAYELDPHLLDAVHALEAVAEQDANANGDVIGRWRFPWRQHVAPRDCPFTLLDEELFGTDREQVRDLAMSTGLFDAPTWMCNTRRLKFQRHWSWRQERSSCKEAWDTARTYLMSRVPPQRYARNQVRPEGVREASPMEFLELVLARRPSAHDVVNLQQAYTEWCMVITSIPASANKPNSLHAPWDAAGFLYDPEQAYQEISGAARSRFEQGRSKDQAEAMRDLKGRIRELDDMIDHQPPFQRTAWRTVIERLGELQHALAEKKRRRKTSTESKEVSDDLSDSDT